MIIDEREKFLAYEKIRQKGLYNMFDRDKVIAYARKYFSVDISKEEYFEIIENYSTLKRRYL